MKTNYLNNFYRWMKIPEKERTKTRRAVETVVQVGLMWLLITTYIVQNSYIPSSSMESTLLIGDRLFVNKFIYRFVDVKKKDIIIFKYPEDKYYPGPEKKYYKIPLVPVFINKRPEGISDLFKWHNVRDFVKRAIGMPGEIFEMKNKKVYINEKLYKIKESIHKTNFSAYERDFFGPVYIPKKGDEIKFKDLNIFEMFCIKKYFESYDKKFEFKIEFKVDGVFQNIENEILNLPLRKLAVLKDRLEDENKKVEFLFSDFKLDDRKIDSYIMTENCYIALGDNRDNSSDSRFWGFVPETRIMGKPIVLYWPFTRFQIF